MIDWSSSDYTQSANYIYYSPTYEGGVFLTKKTDVNDHLCYNSCTDKNQAILAEDTRVTDYGMDQETYKNKIETTKDIDLQKSPKSINNDSLDNNIDSNSSRSNYSMYPPYYPVGPPIVQNFYSPDNQYTNGSGIDKFSSGCAKNCMFSHMFLIMFIILVVVFIYVEVRLLMVLKKINNGRT